MDVFQRNREASASRFGFVTATISNAANGYDAQAYLQNEQLKFRRDGDVAAVVKEFRAGDPAAKNAAQFYAPLMVQFHDGARWIIFTSTSCRTDRIKGQLWDAENLKRLDPLIEMAFLAYPDDALAKEVRAFERQKEKYDSGEEISSLDDVILFSVLLAKIKVRAKVDRADEDVLNVTEMTVTQPTSVAGRDEPVEDKDESEKQDQKEPEGNHQAVDSNSTFSNVTDLLSDREFIDSAKSEGWLFDFNGRAFEKDVANNLNNERYLSFWKRDEQIADDFGFESFTQMVDAFGLDRSAVRQIKASADKEVIGLLPTGGQPKTDVLAKVEMNDGSVRDVTVSCKRTNSSSVSVHQYTADAFADVLDRNNGLLRVLLNVFQTCHNIGTMPEGDRSMLERELSVHREKLCRWGLRGYGYPVSSSVQYANYLVVYKPQERYFAAHTIEAYIEKLLKHSTLSFGTPFSWTFASKQAGKSIQLKLPIIK